MSEGRSPFAELFDGARVQSDVPRFAGVSAEGNLCRNCKLLYDAHDDMLRCPPTKGPTLDALSSSARATADAAAKAADDKPKRVPVDYRYDALHPNFVKMLAQIAAYADAKYGSWSQYMKARLEGEKAPLNHAREHLRQYEMGEPYDHFDGDPRWHLAAAAYNLMMEFWYHTRFGHKLHPSARAAAVERAASGGDR